MILIVILFLISLGIYKLCIYLNTTNDVNKKINNIILKICINVCFVILIMLLYNGLDGYFKGCEGYICPDVIPRDCYYYGLAGLFCRIQKYYWTIPIFLVCLIYIIIYKIKYKDKVIRNKVIYIILFLIALFPLYKTIFNKIYSSINDYKYEIIVIGYDYNNYHIQVYKEKINVIKKEQVVCSTIPCEPIYNGEYEINFSDNSMKEIYDYVNDLFSNDDLISKTIIFNNIEDDKESSIIKSIITNDENYINEMNSYYNYKIVTDFQYKTLQKDGGSHINIYYKINLSENKIIKYEDKYVGFEGYEYKDKIIYEKNISNDINNKLKNIIEDLINKEDINNTNNYSPYIIEYGDINNKKIYNSESIKLLENVLKIIDNQ